MFFIIYFFVFKLCKLENLYEVEEYNFNIPGLTVGTITKIGKVVHLVIDSGSYFYNKAAGSVVLNIPAGFRPRKFLNFSSQSLTNTPNCFKLTPDGRLIKVFSDSKDGAYYLSITYFVD